MTRRLLPIVAGVTLGLLWAASVGGCPLNPTDGTDCNCDPNVVCDPNDYIDPNYVIDPNDANKSVHEQIMTEILPNGYEGTSTCLACHSGPALDLMDTAHWKWEGPVGDLVDQDGVATDGDHGKIDMLNAFCIAVPSNEGRCTQCHPSYGWKDNTFDLTDAENIDCLVCHDTTGTYKKHPSANGGGGPPALVIDGTLTVVGPEDLQEVAYSVGEPTRASCGSCHFYAGGGDNVKKGTLASSLADPTYEMDVHMGSTATGGKDFRCQTCHEADDHGISGMVWHSVTEGGESPDCVRCHTLSPHPASNQLSPFLNAHTAAVACETCHIPTFSRQMATKMAWYWDEAGPENEPDTIETQFGQPTWDAMKGRFVWGKDVQPVYRWYDGQWTRMIINVSDTFTAAGTEADPVIMQAPTATAATDGAKIYPFKKFVGRQPADSVNHRILVPHLFGTATGDHPYWVEYDWDLALQDGTTYAGQPYSGNYEFVNTVSYLRVSHEVAPADEAKKCNECHGVASFWEQIGIEDPA